MSRKITNPLDYGIEEELDPTVKFNSLLSVTVSTIMCIAAKCPLPKSNVETTKLFLSTISDENGKTPRNINAFLSLLNNYSGPYESHPCPRENKFEKSEVEKLPQVKDKKSSQESVSISKATTPQASTKEASPVEGSALAKRSPRMSSKKSEREPAKKGGKSVGSRISASKSMISSKS